MKTDPLIKLTFERANELLRYDPDTGEFYWRIGRPGLKAGTRAGTTCGWGRGGYFYIGIECKQYLLHRIAFLLMTGEWPLYQIDHVDGDPRNNRWNNLRLATASKNQANRSRQANNASGYKGVSWNKVAGKWQVFIQHRHLGNFSNKEYAARVYDLAALELFGEFAKINEGAHV